jgi:hypothetical protein
MSEDFLGRWFLTPLPDGRVRLRGLIDCPAYRIEPVLIEPKGKALFGLSYEEAIQYAWVEVDEGGNFVSGEKLPPGDPWEPGDPLPPFLKKRPAEN